MWLITLAWKNLWRNRGRSLITMAAVFFAVILACLVSSLQRGVFDNLIKNVVSFYTGYIQIHQKGYWDEQTLENSFERQLKNEELILKQSGVTAITARLEAFALASSEKTTRGCLVAGIIPEKEDKVISLKSKITAGEYIRDEDRAVLLSAGMADRLSLSVGDTLVLLGQGYHGASAAGKYPVKGLVKFGSPELNDKTAFLPLKLAQELYSAENILTAYVLSVDNPKNIAGMVAGLSRTLDPEFEIMSWEKMMPGVKQHIQTDMASMNIIVGILYLLICFGIFGTLLMMMAERKFELGMLVAIGMNKRKLSALLLLETILVVITGCWLGILASIPLIYYLNKHPIRIGGDMAASYERFGFEAIFPASTDLNIFITQGIVVLVLGVLLSFYPVYNIIRLNPVKAMRK